MISQGIQAFAGKKVLLLQGPVGPFFARLSGDLRAAGAQVFKVNFNAGDWLFYPRMARNFRGTMEEWPIWCEALILQLNIDVILLFGDCRPIHKSAHAIASRHGLEIGVFEEGYVRPDYVTLERFGVNGFSTLPQWSEHYRNSCAVVTQKRLVGNTYWFMVWYGFCYFAAAILGSPWFSHYEHHRPLHFLEAFPWIRSVWRKQWYRLLERGIEEKLVDQWSQRYFLVPLQVFNDAQISEHSEIDSVEHFIETTIASFARHAPADTLLVFKHHPMDRGYTDYKALIMKLSQQAGIAVRVLYIHDQHLPTLLDHACGVVVINSTVGLSSLHHGTPVYVHGNAIYDLEGLTWQGTQDDFWHVAQDTHPDINLYLKFVDYLIATAQLNGSFYKRLHGVDTSTGLAWS